MKGEEHRRSPVENSDDQILGGNVREPHGSAVNDRGERHQEWQSCLLGEDAGIPHEGDYREQTDGVRREKNGAERLEAASEINQTAQEWREKPEP